MNPHLSEDQIEQSLRPIQPSDAEAERHLRGCNLCQDRLAAAKAVQQIYSALSADHRAFARDAGGHLSMERMLAYRDGDLEDEEREQVQHHLDQCALCTEEMDQLSGADALLDAVFVPEPLLETAGASAPVSASAPVAAAVGGASGTRRSVFRRLRYTLQSALPAAIAACLVALVFLWRPPASSNTVVLERNIAKLNTALTRSQEQSNIAAASASESQRRLDALLAGMQRRDQMVAQLGEKIGGLGARVGDMGEQVRRLNPTGDAQSVVRETGPGAAVVAAARSALSAVETGRISAPPLLSELPPPQKGAAFSSDFQIRSPFRVAVESLEPVLTWSPAASVGRVPPPIQVTVFEGDRPVRGPVTVRGKTAWKVAPPLEPGHLYSWRIRRLDGSGEITPGPADPNQRGEAPTAALFKVLNAADRKELQRERAAFSSSGLALSLIDAHFGLLDRAEAELKQLQEKHPDSAAIKTLLTSVGALR